jgi:hypothetical protein
MEPTQVPASIYLAPPISSLSATANFVTSRASVLKIEPACQQPPARRSPERPHRFGIFDGWSLSVKQTFNAKFEVAAGTLSTTTSAAETLEVLTPAAEIRETTDKPKARFTEVVNCDTRLLDIQEEYIP